MNNRLDEELVKRKYFDTRNKAKQAIISQIVAVDGNIETKPSKAIKDQSIITIVGEKPKYVSRGGLKLEKAINVFKIDFSNKTVLDIGSSTGGFSDCALQNGAKKIIAVDVGSQQFAEKLRSDSRIQLYEQTDFRDMDLETINQAQIIVADVSFVSITKLLLQISQIDGIEEIVCLIKPQFECGKSIAKKFKGVIKDTAIHIKIIYDIVNAFADIGFVLYGLDFSPIVGGDGNIEYVAYFKKLADRTNNISVEQVVENAKKELSKKGI